MRDRGKQGSRKTHCNKLCNTLQLDGGKEGWSETHCNTHCNTLQHTATERREAGNEGDNEAMM